MFQHWIWRNLLQVIAGILLVAAASWLVTYSTDRQLEKKVRPGWVMVRSPGNLQTVTLYNGDVWAGGVNGLFRFDQRTAAALRLPPGSEALGSVHDLLADRTGKLWVGHQQGIAIYDGTKWDVFTGFPSGKLQPATALLEAHDGAIWIGLAEGVLRQQPDEAQFYPLPMGPVDVLFQDREGRIWAASSDPRRGGLACFSANRWKTYSTHDGLVHPSVTCVTQTHDGTLWIGTGFANAGGANYFTAGGSLAAITKQDGLAGDKVRQIYQDQDRNIWFCSEYDGVAVFKDGKRVALLTTADGLAGQEVKKIVQDSSSAYWLATDQGLTRIEKLF